MRSNWARTPSRQSGPIFFCRLHITLVVPDWQCCPGKGYTKKAAISHKDQRVHSYILKLENANEQQQVNTSPLFQRIVRFCFLFDHIILGINNINKQSDPIYAPNFQTYYCPPVKNFKGTFINSAKKQTSQMFVVTHSPFIIHIENRRNDKVIVLARDGDPYDISS